MEVLAPGSAHARPPAQPPIDSSGNFAAEIFWRKCLQSNLKIFQTKNFKNPKRKIPKIVATFVSAGAKGSARTPLGPICVT
jgi:hypothetical protein